MLEHYEFSSVLNMCQKRALLMSDLAVFGLLVSLAILKECVTYWNVQQFTLSLCYHSSLGTCGTSIFVRPVNFDVRA